MTEVASPSSATTMPKPVGGSQNGHPRASETTFPITLFPTPSTITMLSPLPLTRLPRMVVRSAPKNTMIPLLTLSRTSLPAMRLS